MENTEQYGRLWEYQYLNIIKKIVNEGYVQYNERTGKNCYFYLGDIMKFDLSSGYFPMLTTKKLFMRQNIAELLGFIRGYDNAKQFRDLGCNFWNANANESKHWLENPNRKGEDDLGRIYGVQARDWTGPNGEKVDQLKNVIDKLSRSEDDRRLIVTHLNPGETHLMSLQPCHMFYTFGLRKEYLDMFMFQRSCDVPLGVPMNISSYALLLLLVARITGHKPGMLNHYLWNIHIYEDQYETALEQMNRIPNDPPKIEINENIRSLNDLETWVTTDDFKIVDYNHQGVLKYEFSA